MRYEKIHTTSTNRGKGEIFMEIFGTYLKVRGAVLHRLRARTNRIEIDDTYI